MIRRLLLASLGAFFVIGFGEPAVAQSYPQWPDVDCGAAKLTTTASPPRCLRGPVFNDVGGSEHYGSEDCTGEQWAVFTRSSASFGFARLANLRALVPSCSTRLGFGDIAAKLKTPCEACAIGRNLRAFGLTMLPGGPM
jgi:hypothetical protein